MKKLNSWQKLFWPSIYSLMVLVLFLGILKASPRISSFDLWWQIRTGDLLLQGIFPRADLFSYTAYGSPWILHEWLSTLIFSALYKYFGIAGLIALKALLLALTIGTLFKAILLRKGSNILFAFALALTAALGTARIWTVRPHLFSLLFLAILIYLYFNYKENKGRSSLYYLPLLFLIWVNTHGGFILGFIFLSLGITAELAGYLLKRTSDKLKSIKELSLAAAASFLFCFLNPNTYQGVLYPFTYIGNSVMPSFAISEWAPASWANAKDLIIFIIILTAILFFKRSALKLFDLIIAAPFLIMGFLSIRMIPFSVIVIISVLSTSLQTALYSYWQSFAKLIHNKKIEKYLQTRSKVFLNIERSSNNTVVLIIIIFLACTLVLSGKYNSFFGFALKKGRYPSTTITYLKQHPIPGNIFNQYRYGGYLIKFLPGKKVFIDGRMDIYRYPVYNEYNKIFKQQPGWQRSVKKYNITQILVDKNSKLASGLKKNWDKVAEDDTAALFFGSNY